MHAYKKIWRGIKSPLSPWICPCTELLFLGNECGIVLLSTVRSQSLESMESITPDRGWLSEHLGFLTDTHIINVGITRCQYGLIIVGMAYCE